MAEEEKKEENIEEEELLDGSIHVAGELECRCGAVKDFGPDYRLPSPPYEIKCDACGAVLITGDYTEDLEAEAEDDSEGGEEEK